MKAFILDYMPGDPVWIVDYNLIPAMSAACDKKVCFSLLKIQVYKDYQV